MSEPRRQQGDRRLSLLFIQWVRRHGVSRSGDISADLTSQIRLTSPENGGLMRAIWRTFKATATSYAPASELRDEFLPALDFPDVVGIAIATRPDCLPDDVVELLSEINQKTFACWSRTRTADHTRKDIRSDESVLFGKGIRRRCPETYRKKYPVVTHLILGLP